jgi:hypothetical protein
METYIGNWIYYPWVSERHPHDLVHAVEFNKRVGEFHMGLGECIGIEEEYLVLKTKENVFRAKPWDRMQVLPPSKFKWYDKVREVQRPEVQGIVDKIIWHDNDAEFKYFLIVNGKPKSRRYNPDELELL